MAYVIEAACGCNMGKIRTNNEDNFYFNGHILQAENNGLMHTMKLNVKLKRKFCVAVFDGMGGENYGEYAAYSAAKSISTVQNAPSLFTRSIKDYLNNMCMQINTAVVRNANDRHTTRMGATLAMLYFTSHRYYICNLGDSRIYQLRKNKLTQLSEDHVEKLQLYDRNGNPRKAPLTQHLGIDPNEMVIEPHIANGWIRHGDQYLLCSDGLTDMLSDEEILNIMNRPQKTSEHVGCLIEAALEKGGKDNITVILCKII